MKRYGKTQNVYKRDRETGKLTDIFYSPTVEYLANCLWRFTEKIDGTNIRIIWQRSAPDVLEFRGRSDKAQLPSGFVQAMHNIMDFGCIRTGCQLIDYKPDTVCIYGEGYGAGIQKGGKYSETKKFAAFDIAVDGAKLPQPVVSQLLQEWGVPPVPLYMYAKLDVGIMEVENGLRSDFGDFYAEGLVARPMEYIRDWRGRRVQCKIKHCDFFKGESDD